MIRNFLAAASVLALGLSAAPAFAQTLGNVGANYGRANLDTPLGDADTDALQAEGSVAFVGGPVNWQMDGAFTNFDSDDLGGEASVVTVTGHAKFQLEQAQIGGFLGLSNNDDATLWGVGVEGKVSNDTGSLYAQAGYGKADDLDDVDFWALRGEGRVFFSDNFRAGASLGYVKADNDFLDLDIWTVGADAEYRFANSPFSVTVGYERNDMDDLDVTADTFRIGGRVTFGGSLRDLDRAGVGQGGINTLMGGTLGTAIVGIAGELSGLTD